MYNFSDAKVFDNEPSIEEKICKFDEDYETNLNVKFCDSKSYREIQICDAISGFVGKMYNFLSKTDEEQIKKFVVGLDKESGSFKTLKAFFELMNESNKETDLCFMKVNPLFIDRRFDLLYNKVRERG